MKVLKPILYVFFLSFIFVSLLYPNTTSAAPAITSPADGLTLSSGSTQRFNWTDNGTAVTAWRLWWGTYQGGADIDNSGDLEGSRRSATVYNGLPTDGSTIYM